MDKVYIRLLRNKAKELMVELLKTDDIQTINRYRQPAFEEISGISDRFLPALGRKDEIVQFHIPQFIKLFGVDPKAIVTKEQIQAQAEIDSRRATEEEEDKEALAEETARFESFLKADSGIFDGFDFADVFHQRIHKEEAIRHLRSNIDGICRHIDVGRPYVDVYFFCDPNTPKKQVRFHRSVYVF